MKNVMTGPMVMTALTTVVVTVLMTLGVTNRLVTVTGDVTRDIPMATVAKGVHLDNLEWTAENGVVDIVLTVNPVTTSVECVHMAVRTGILDRTVITFVKRDTSAKNV